MVVKNIYTIVIMQILEVSCLSSELEAQKDLEVLIFFLENDFANAKYYILRNNLGRNDILQK